MSSKKSNTKQKSRSKSGKTHGGSSKKTAKPAVSANSSVPTNQLLEVLSAADYHKTMRVQLAYNFMYDQLHKAAPGSKLYCFAFGFGKDQVMTNNDDLKTKLETAAEQMREPSNDGETIIDDLLGEMVNLFILPPEWLLADANGKIPAEWLGTKRTNLIKPGGRAELARRENLLFKDKDYAALAKCSILSEDIWRGIASASKKVSSKANRVADLTASNEQQAQTIKHYQEAIGVLKPKLKDAKSKLRSHRKNKDSATNKKGKKVNPKKHAKRERKLTKKLGVVQSALEKSLALIEKATEASVALENELNAAGSVGTCVPPDPRDVPLFVTSVFYWDSALSTFPEVLKRLNNKRQGTLLGFFFKARNSQAGIPDAYSKALSVYDQSFRNNPIRVDYERAFTFDGGLNQLFQVDAQAEKDKPPLANFAPYPLRCLIIAHNTRDTYPQKKAERDEEDDRRKSTKIGRASGNEGKTRRTRRRKKNKVDTDPIVQAALADISSSSSSSGDSSSSSSASGSGSGSGSSSSSSSSQSSDAISPEMELSSDEKELSSDEKEDFDSAASSSSSDSADDSAGSLSDSAGDSAENEAATEPASVGKKQQTQRPTTGGKSPANPHPTMGSKAPRVSTAAQAQESSSSSSSSDSDSAPRFYTIPLRQPSRTYIPLGTIAPKRSLEEAHEGDDSSSSHAQQAPKRPRNELEKEPETKESGKEYTNADEEAENLPAPIEIPSPKERVANVSADDGPRGKKRPREPEPTEAPSSEEPAAMPTSPKKKRRKAADPIEKSQEKEKEEKKEKKKKEKKEKKKEEKKEKKKEEKRKEKKKKKEEEPEAEDPIEYEVAESSEEASTSSLFRIPENKTLEDVFEDAVDFFAYDDPMSLCRDDRNGRVNTTVREHIAALADRDFHRRYFDPFPDPTMGPDFEQMHDAYAAAQDTPGLKSAICPSVLLRASYVMLHATSAPHALFRSIADSASASEAQHETALLEGLQNPNTLQRIGSVFELLHNAADTAAAYYGTTYTDDWHADRNTTIPV